jgi:hypothetical protein
MGGTEVEIVEDRQPLACYDPVAGVYIERFDPAARHGPDAGKMELIVADATRRRHGTNQRTGLRLPDLQLQVRQLRFGESNCGRQLRSGSNCRRGAHGRRDRGGRQRAARRKSGSYSDSDRRNAVEQSPPRKRQCPTKERWAMARLCPINRENVGRL